MLLFNSSLWEIFIQKTAMYLPLKNTVLDSKKNEQEHINFTVENWGFKNFTVKYTVVFF